MAGEARRLIILGATGSIGAQTVEVVRALAAGGGEAGRTAPIEIVGLAAGSSLDALCALGDELGVGELALADGAGARASAHVRTGPDAAERLVREVECDIVMGAIVGAAGLGATLAAVELGRDIALANKETLVAAGEIVVPAAHRSGARLLPVDSEHSAIWQCLTGLGAEPWPPMSTPACVRKVTLTASGGPFRSWPADRIARATPAEALNHPTWTMGPKVTIDSASLMNKALELIEAHWLFGLLPQQLDILVHPQSIVHALVEHVDGSVIAQLGAPDMRCPIQYALTFPDRSAGPAPKLDLARAGRLDFVRPDYDVFPAPLGAMRVMERGGAAGAIFNAANEAAVEAFLAGAIAFGRIGQLALGALDALADPAPQVGSLADVRAADAEARRWVAGEIGVAAG
ncbi:MAG: 1-deoxy-D-xylulose-5-phosphate reductoisomerase [Phycisphaerales bacterium JB039]